MDVDGDRGAKDCKWNQKEGKYGECTILSSLNFSRDQSIDNKVLEGQRQ